MTGIAVGNAFLNAQAKKQQMQQQAQEFPLRMEALQQQNEFNQATFPLKLRGLQLNNQLATMSVASGLLNQENAVEKQRLDMLVEQSKGELARTMGSISANGQWGTDTADTFIAGLGQRAPWLMGTPAWQSLTKMQADAKTAAATKAQHEATIQAQKEIWGLRTDTSKEIAASRLAEKEKTLAARAGELGTKWGPLATKKAQLIVERYRNNVKYSLDPATNQAEFDAAQAALAAIDDEMRQPNVNPQAVGAPKTGSSAGGTSFERDGYGVRLLKP